MATDYDDSTDLLEDSEYSKKTEFSKAEIAANHVKNILLLRSEDMRPGYTTWVPDKTGTLRPQVIPDVRKKLVGAVESFLNLLTPELEVQKMEQIKTDYEKEKKKVFDRFCYAERKSKVWNEKTQLFEWELTGERFIPQKGAIVLMEEKDCPGSMIANDFAGGWDIKVDAYWDFMVELADDLFCKLNKVVHTLEYFKGGVSL
jgi:hypothetical protein